MEINNTEKSSGNILVVDDTPANLDLLASILKRRGYTVRPVPSGRMALMAAELEPPDLILLDITMPDMDGFEVCSRLKKNEKLSSIPVIFISALTETLDKVKAFGIGGVDYITKPFQFEEVQARIETHLKLHRFQTEMQGWNEQLSARVAAQTAQIQQEITDRVKAQVLLEEEKELLSTTLLSIQDGVVTTTPNGIITLLNRSAEKIAEVSKAEAIGKDFAAVIPLTDEKTNQPVSYVETFRPDGRTQETRVLTSMNGKRKIISSSVGPVLDAQGGLLGYVFVFDDITEHRLLESQYALSQKLESIGQLAAGIAHEINTPMQFVGDNTQFLKDSFGELSCLLIAYREAVEQKRKTSPEDATWSELGQREAEADIDYLLQEIPSAIVQSMDGIERVRKIVLAMKAFSHPGGEGMQMADINRNIETTVTISRNAWKYVADLDLELDPDLPLVPCIVDEVNQVLLNLIINAAHAIEETIENGQADKGKIRISTHRCVESICIEVEDTGVGIPNTNIHRIFDPFFTTKKVGKGTGQGLAIAHNVIVNKHHGQILVFSEPGRGTKFEIRLPLVSLDQEEGGVQ